MKYVLIEFVGGNMKSQNKIVVIATLALAFYFMINVNAAVHAQVAPNKPTLVSPPNETVFPYGTSNIALQCNFSDPDEDDYPQSANWKVIRETAGLPHLRIHISIASSV